MVAQQRGAARQQGGERQDHGPGTVETDQVHTDEGGEGGRQHEAGGAAQQGEVDDGQCAVPLLQEADTGIDHGGADEQRKGGQCRQCTDDQRCVDRQGAGHGKQGCGPFEVMKQAIEKHQQHDQR